MIDDSHIMNGDSHDYADFGTLDSPLTGTEYDAQRREMSKLGVFDRLGKQILPKLLQVGAIIAVAAAGLIGGSLAVLAAGGIMLGFELVRAHVCNKGDLNRELILYHNEIATVLGKPAGETLTIQDMRHAADEKCVGDKAIKPLKMELDHLAYRARYNYLMGAVRALITTAASFVLSGALGQTKQMLDSGKPLSEILTATSYSSWFAFSGAVGIVGAITMGAENLVRRYFDGHKPISVYHELDQLQSASKQRDIRPEQVFDVILKLNKDVALDIERHMGKPYEELTGRNKNRILKVCEPKVHAMALAEAINNGTLPVTAVALSACGQMEWPETPQASPVNAPAQPGMTQPQAQTVKSFVADLASKRNATAQTVAMLPAPR